MIVVLRQNATPAQIEPIRQRAESLGCTMRIEALGDRAVVLIDGARNPETRDALKRLRAFEVVEKVLPLDSPFVRVAKTDTSPYSFEVDGVRFGGNEIVVIAGPCTVESEEQLFSTAEAVAAAGATVLRGGAYKPSTSPYSFHGLGVAALEMLQQAGRQFGLAVVTEVMDPRKVELVANHASILQIGARNMQNYDLLREAGRSGKPVLLKRGMNARLEEWLLAAEYIAVSGSERIILCERGIRTFETSTRNTLDLSAVASSKMQTKLPVMVDPSHGTGRRELVGPMSLAAIAAGADGPMIEVHNEPEEALKDGAQSLSTEQFADLVPSLERVAEAVGRTIHPRVCAVPG